MASAEEHLGIAAKGPGECRIKGERPKPKVRTPVVLTVPPYPGKPAEQGVGPILPTRASTVRQVSSSPIS